MELYDRTRRDGLIAINLRDDDELIAVRRVAPGEKVIMVSHAGKAIMWDEGEVRAMGRDTMGVTRHERDRRSPRCWAWRSRKTRYRPVRHHREGLRQAHPREPSTPSTIAAARACTPSR